MDSYTGGFSNNLAILPINKASYGILLYENNSGYKPILRTKILNGFDIQFLDDEGNLLDFNNVDWHVTLQLDITKKLNILDKTFPHLMNAIDSGINDPSGNLAENNPNLDVPPNESTGDTDLDFLMYQNHIYQ